MSKSVNGDPNLINKVTIPLIFTFIVLGLFGGFYLYSMSQWLTVGLGFMLVLALSPIGWIKLGGQKDSFAKWIGHIWLLQFGLVFLFVPWYFALQSYVPDLHAPPLGKLIAVSGFTWGLFPWTLFALLTVLLALAKYTLNKPMTVAGVLGDCLPKKLRIIRVVTDVGGRIASHFSLGLTTVVFAVYLLNILFGSLLTPVQAGIRGEFFMLFILLSVYPISERKLQQIQKKFIPDNNIAGWLLLLFLSAFAAILFVHFFAAVSMFSDNHAKQYLLSDYPIFEKSMRNNCLYFVLWSWWVGWMYIYAGLIAEHSAGRRVFSVLVANISLPMIGAFIFYSYYTSAHHIPALDFKLNEHPIVLTLWLVSAGFLALRYFYRNPSATRHAFCGEVDSSVNLACPRMFTMAKFIQGQFQLIAIYLSGLEMTYLLASLSLFAFLLTVLALLLLPYWLWRHRGQREVVSA